MRSGPRASRVGALGTPWAVTSASAFSALHFLETGEIFHPVFSVLFLLSLWVSFQLCGVFCVFLCFTLVCIGCARLRGCVGFSLAALSRGCSLAAMRRLLLAVAAVVPERGLQAPRQVQASLVAARRLRCPVAWGTVPDQGSLSPALASGFLTTGPPQSPMSCFLSGVSVKKDHMYSQFSHLYLEALFLPCALVIYCFLFPP